MRSRLMSLLAATLVVMAALLPAGTPVSAHVFLFKLTPGDGEIVTVPPPSVTAEFTGEVIVPGSFIAVFTPDGVQVDGGDTWLDPENAKRISVSLPPLADGAYLGRWTVLDVLDGHESSGTFTFTVSAAPVAEVVPTPEPVETPEAPPAESAEGSEQTFG